METKAQASANSSEPRLPPPIQLNPLETSSREDLAQVVEGYLGTNWRVSHHLNGQKDAQLLSSVPVYVWQRQGRNRAGLLVLRAGQPAVYWNTEQDCPYTLKLQVPATFTHSGTWILIATLSRTERLLTLEDAWVADGKSLLQTNRYSDRWPKLQEAFAALKEQQYFLGCELRLVQPMSFAHFLTVCNEKPEEGTVWEFQPDVPLRRRLVWMIPGSKGDRSAIPSLRRPASEMAKKDDTGFIPLIKCTGSNPRHTAYTKPTTMPQPRIHTTVFAQQRAALLKKDTTTSLPDSYWLEAEGGASLGRVCVNRLSDSQMLRQATATANTLIVEVKYNESFKKYEVARILPDSTSLSAKDVFPEVD
jgi:hypothetical protein